MEEKNISGYDNAWILNNRRLEGEDNIVEKVCLWDNFFGGNTGCSVFRNRKVQTKEYRIDS